MSAVPAWIQMLQALLTPAIAVAVGTIAFMQWRTAHQKVNLDLFERRMAIYEGVIERISVYFNDNYDDAHATAGDGLSALEAKARFLFGPEVANLIGKFRADIMLHAKAYKQACRTDLSPLEKADASAAHESASVKLRPFNEEMTAAVLPYLRMDSRTVATPLEWIDKRNRIRLSYADEKQK